MVKDSLKSITKGTSIIFIGTIIASIIGLINQFLLGRILGPTDYGLFSIGLSIMTILCVFPHFGLGPGLTQYIPYNIKKKKYKKVKNAIIFSIKFTSIVGLITSILLFIFSDLIAIYIFNNEELGVIIKAFSISLTFWALHNNIGALTQAFKKPKYYVYIENLLMPLIQVSVLIVLSIIGYKLFGAVIAFILSSIITALSYIYLAYSKFIKSLKCQENHLERDKTSSELLRLSFPLFLAGFTYTFMQYPDKLILGAFTNSFEVGLYSAALTISSLLLLIYSAFSFNFRPILSEHYARKNFEDMSKLNSSCTKWIFLITFPLVFYVIIYSKDIVELIYGNLFLDASVPLSILAVGVAVTGLTGLTGETLISIKKTKQNFYSELIGAISNIVLNMTLIPFFGILGAAIGTSLSIIIKNGSSFLFVYNTMKFNPYNWDYLKIIIYSITPLILIYYIFSQYLKLKLAFLIAIPLFILIYLGILFITRFFDEYDMFIIINILKKLKLIK